MNTLKTASNKEYITGKSHSFSVDVAMDVGIDAAAVYNHIHYWLDHNRIHGKCQQDGMTWTFQSFSTMEKYMPYLSQKQIRNSIDKLLAHGYIIKGNYNKNKFDHTAWYTIPGSDPNDGSCVPEDPDSEEEEQNSKKDYDVPKTANRCARDGQMDVPKTAHLYKDKKPRSETKDIKDLGLDQGIAPPPADSDSQ